MNFNTSATGFGNAPKEQFETFQNNTTMQLEGLKLSVQTQQSVKKWVEEKKPAVRASKPLADFALSSVAQLPMQTRGHWQGRMQLLQTLASPPREDAIAIVRLLNYIEPEIKQLQSLSVDGNAPGTHPSVVAIVNARDAFIKNIGVLHPGVQYTDRFANFNNSISARESQMLRTAVFIVGIGGALMTLVGGLLRGKNDTNFTLIAVFLGTSALAMGYGDITRTGTEGLARQIGWLTNPGAWQNLQNTYNIRGPQWSTFTRALYDNRGSNPHVTTALTGSRDITKQQRDAVLGLVPANATEVLASVTAMLDSAGPPKGKDFRTFGNLLALARTPETHNIVITYIQSATSPQALAALANQPGTQEKLKKQNQAPQNPPVT